MKNDILISTPAVGNIYINGENIWSVDCVHKKLFQNWGRWTNIERQGGADWKKRNRKKEFPLLCLMWKITPLIWNLKKDGKRKKCHATSDVPAGNIRSLDWLNYWNPWTKWERIAVLKAKKSKKVVLKIRLL